MDRTGWVVPYIERHLFSYFLFKSKTDIYPRAHIFVEYMAGGRLIPMTTSTFKVCQSVGNMKHGLSSWDVIGRYRGLSVVLEAQLHITLGSAVDVPIAYGGVMRP